MSKDQRPTVSSSSTDIPPPPDPFPTYQTPFPRSQTSDDPNAFVLFRRFADSQLSSLFSRLPPLLGQLDSSSKSESQLPRSNELQSHSGRAQVRYEGGHSLVDSLRETRFGQPSESEGQRKRVEQESEELRMWNLNQANLSEAVLESKDMWKHKPERAITELDIYERIVDLWTETVAETNIKPISHVSAMTRHPELPDMLDPAGSPFQAFQWWNFSPYSPFRLENENKISPFLDHTHKQMDWISAFQELIHSPEDGSGNGDADENARFKTHLQNSYEAARRWNSPEVDRNPLGPSLEEVESPDWIVKLNAELEKLRNLTCLDTSSQIAHVGPSVVSDLQSTPLQQALPWPAKVNSPNKDMTYNTTTINRRTLPDGTIETRRVEKRGYRDGREEETESVQLQPPHVGQSSLHQARPPSNPKTRKVQVHVDHDDARIGARSYGKGWFWV